MGSVALLGELSVWQPIPKYPLHVAANPDANVYGVTFLLTLASGFLFGAVPVRQVLHTHPYEIVKSGSRTTGGRRITIRDLLPAAQIAISAVLVTSSMVAVRGMMRSLHSANATTYSISPRYFRAAGTTLLSGRAFTWHDGKMRRARQKSTGSLRAKSLAP